MKFELSTQDRINYLSQGSSWIKTNWLKLTAITIILFLIVKKDIQFGIYLGNQNAKTEKYEPISKNKSDATENFSVIAAKIPRPKKVALVKKTTSPEITVTKKRNLDPSKFANISVLLQPSLFEIYKNQTDILKKKKSNCEKYVKQFKSIAIAEKEKYGIPASITLAQGLLETDAGSSSLARRNHNHFGMKCFSRKCRKGHCSNHTDDSHKDFFRVYKSNWESFRAHSTLLQNKRYRSLKSYGPKDYKSWAIGIRKAGYATDPRYAEKLIKIIDEMKLWKFD